ncbi:hypothetical protein F5B21DRAFT_516118 [Xylaria acuta]|nr:hypothetical protein F5B21DRAFT_516118 [Xylaria acuta]
MTMLPKSDIEIISPCIDDENGYYRLRVGRRVQYLAISSDVFDDDTTRRPYLLTTWHELRVDVLSLERTRRFRSGVHEVQYNGAPAIAKIACFKWDIARVERGTGAYSILAHYHSQHPNESPIAPNFLGHLTENGRTMGFLLQKVDGEPACVNDLANCEALLLRLHRLGMIHGDVNLYNFLVDRASGSSMRLGLAKAELLPLPAELAEETGRGTTM